MDNIIYFLRILHGNIHTLLSSVIRIIVGKLKNYNVTFLLMTPEHGNIGDQAIAKAEITMLRSVGVDYVEISADELFLIIKYKCLFLFGKSSLLVQGGGYLGSLWPESEEMLRCLIKSRRESKIILFPNTIFYENSEHGSNEFRKSVEIYNSHPNLIIYAREKISFEVMKETYNNVKLAPDIVLSLKEDDEKYVRSGCLLCLRNDGEKTRTDKDEKIIRKQADALFNGCVHDTDMHIQSAVTISQRDSAINDKLREFKSCELVITDRLHGMIFAAITGTPCIVIDSKSPKVRGCYDWIKNLQYVKFADDAMDITKIYNNIPNVNFQYDNSELLFCYDQLKIDILDVVK